MLNMYSSGDTQPRYCSVDEHRPLWGNDCVEYQTLFVAKVCTFDSDGNTAAGIVYDKHADSQPAVGD